VAKCLTAGMWANPAIEMTLAARDLSKLDAFLATLPEVPRSEASVPPRRVTFEGLGLREYDAIINCVGLGDPAALATAPESAIFAVTEEFDHLVLEYLKDSPGTRYISISSGAVYGGDFSEPVSESTRSVFPANQLTSLDFYGLAKLASEAKHRAISDRAIVDLRVFGLYSRHMDPTARYFMNDVYRAVAAGAKLEVGQEDINRDYVDPADLTALVLGVLDAPPRNDVFDVYSACPVSKFELLDDFAERYGLAYVVGMDTSGGSPTGPKLNYYSANKRAQQVGYFPERTSLDTLRNETDARLSRMGAIDKSQRREGREYW
jgi:nucleoside-diphosphate-sugar epimerase